MPKRKLADRILDEILTLRRPLSLMLEFDDHEDGKSQRDQAVSQTGQTAAWPAATGRLVLE
jgi:hypothetical protein